MKNNHYALLLTLCLTIGGTSSLIHAQPFSERDKVVAGVEEAFGKIRTLSTRFSQRSITRGFGAAGEASGVMILKKPSLMSWDYDTPKGMRLVVEQRRLWFYDPEDKIAFYDEIGGYLHPKSPAMFLAGDAPLSDLFNIDLVPAKKEGKLKYVALRLIPKKPQASVKGILLKVDAKTYQIMQTTFVDYLGNRNELTFTEVKTGMDLDNSNFVFTAPQGVISKPFPKAGPVQ